MTIGSIYVLVLVVEHDQRDPVRWAPSSEVVDTALRALMTHPTPPPTIQTEWKEIAVNLGRGVAVYCTLCGLRPSAVQPPSPKGPKRLSGGWQIIGRTPVKLFDLARSEPCLLKAGDTVQFFPMVDPL